MWGWSEVKVAQLCLTLCDPMDYTVHRILQARILDLVASPFSRGACQPRDQTQVSCIAGGFFTSWAAREAQEYWSGWNEVKWSRSVVSGFCNSMDCSLLRSSVHGIFQARVLEWVAISFSRGSSWPRDWTQVSCTEGRHFTTWAPREVLQGSSWPRNWTRSPALQADSLPTELSGKLGRLS